MVSAQAISEMKATLTAKVARWSAKHRRWVLAASVLVLVMDIYGQQFGLGLVVVVLIDAMIIRSVLRLGDWNWYLPSWLEWLPKFSTTEGAPEEAQPAEELVVSHTPQGVVAGPIPGRINEWRGRFRSWAGGPSHTSAGALQDGQDKAKIAVKN